MLTDIERVHLGDNTSRKDVGDCSELAASIEAYGQLAPVVVRQEGDHFILIAGYRRYHAMRYYLNRNTIDVTVLEGGDDPATINLIENIHRADLTFWEECLALQRAYPEDVSLNEIARKLGKSRTWVTPRRRLWELGDDVVARVRAGTMTPKQVAGLLYGEPSADIGAIKARFKPTEKQLRGVATRLLAAGRADAATAITFALGEITLDTLFPPD